MNALRIDRILAELGLGSRSEVKDLIRKGHITVDGRTVSDPACKVDGTVQVICLDGKRQEWKPVRHVMLNKPAGILTAARDKKQKTVMDLLPPLYAASDCMPAGRLDKDTEGMLILTSDGALAHRLITPGKEVGKIYIAEINGDFTREDAERFAGGFRIEDPDGVFDALPAQTRVLEKGPAGSRVTVRVTEGKYHQVRRMFAACGRTVVRLRRTAIGALILDPALGPGGYRELSQEETELLEKPASLEEMEEKYGRVLFYVGA